MRGMYTCGILDVLMQHDIWLDGMVGVSAGVAFGCNYKSRQPGRALRYSKRFAHDKRYGGWQSLLTTGNYYNAQFAYHHVPKCEDVFDVATYDSSPMQCYAVCTDVDSGEAVYQLLPHANDECYEWIRASASMPVVARPVEIGGRRLFDGGLSDSLPLAFMQRQGYERNVVVLTREAGYVKQPEQMMWLMKPLLHRMPTVVKALQERPHHYSEQLAYVEQQQQLGNTWVFRPLTPLNISRTCHDPKQMQRVYDQGREQALAALDELQSWLAG